MTVSLAGEQSWRSDGCSGGESQVVDGGQLGDAARVVLAVAVDRVVVAQGALLGRGSGQPQHGGRARGGDQPVDQLVTHFLHGGAVLRQQGQVFLLPGVGLQVVQLREAALPPLGAEAGEHPTG